MTARSLSTLPIFFADNLDQFIAGAISEEELETNASIYDRYIASLDATLQPRAEESRIMVIGKPAHNRAKHGAEIVHDPMHMLFLVPGAGPHPGIAGNYLHGSVFHIGNDEATGSWVVNVHDADDGAAEFRTTKLADALAMLEDVLASSPFHLDELEGLGFEMN